jgi:hypothetical protein
MCLLDYRVAALLAMTKKLGGEIAADQLNSPDIVAAAQPSCLSSDCTRLWDIEVHFC